MSRLTFLIPVAAILLFNHSLAYSQDVKGNPEASLVRVVDLNIGEPAKVVLHDGSVVQVKVISVSETHEPVTKMLISAAVKVEINGKPADLYCGQYRLPVQVGKVQVDVPVVGAYNKDTNMDWWKLRKDVRLRFWPAGSPWIEPGTFGYPVKQQWLASSTSYSNEPVSRRTTGKVYYHSGIDIGGAEGLTEVIAATDGRVITLGEQVPEGKVHPVAKPRDDVVYLEDQRGWVYRYSHLKTIDPALQPGGKVKKGQRIGYIGKEGSSGGWTHLHFDVSSLMPSGEWGIQDSYAFLWQAYLDEHKPEVLAVARPHKSALVGESVVHDASRSWTKSGKQNFEWLLTDGSKAKGPVVKSIYHKPGVYSEIVKVTDDAGNLDYDFSTVRVYPGAKEDGTATIVGVHVSFYPTFGIKPGDPVIFLSRGRNTGGGDDMYDFGDGTPVIPVPTNISQEYHAANGYGMVTHHYKKPGDYIVKVQRTDEKTGFVAVQRLHVVVR